MKEFVLYGLLSVMGLWCLILSALLYNLWRKYMKILSGVSSGSLEKILLSHIERVDKVVAQNLEIENVIEKMSEDSKSFLSTVGFKRFNPFENTGGNQSFVVSLQNANGDGVIISSMHARDGTRVYAKPIKKGKENGYRFSEEEAEVINKSLEK